MNYIYQSYRSQLIGSLLSFIAVLIPAQSWAVDLDFDESPKELATYMVELQVLTHKLGLSIDAKNKALVQFYLHESVVKLEEIQRDLPEYEGTPVALEIDRMALPAYKVLREAFVKDETTPDYFPALMRSYEGVIATCNACHVSSGRGEIRIVHNTMNPYLQDFTPVTED